MESWERSRTLAGGQGRRPLWIKGANGKLRFKLISSNNRITLGKEACKDIPGKENRTKGRDRQQNNGADKTDWGQMTNTPCSLEIF